MSARRLPSGVRRRDNTDGSVSYQARWRDRAGKQHAATFDTAREAGEYVAEQKRRMRFGSSGDPTTGLLIYGEWWEKWMLSRDIRPSTEERDRSYAQNHILPVFGDVSLRDITYDMVVAWKAALKDGPLAESTVNKLFWILKASLRGAVDADRLAASPARSIKAPTVSHVEAVFLELVELTRIEAAMDPHWALVVPFTVECALRIGEVSAIRVRDVDLDLGIVYVRAGAVYVSRQISGEETRRTEQDGKTKAAIRAVPMLRPGTADRLRAMIADRRLGPNDLLFTGKRRGALDPSNWRERDFYPAVEAAGLGGRRVVPHSLRHSGIAAWIGTGVIDPYEMARMAGHETPGFLYRTYGHLLAKPDQGRRDAIEELWSEAEPEEDDVDTEEGDGDPAPSGS